MKFKMILGTVFSVFLLVGSVVYFTVQDLKVEDLDTCVKAKMSKKVLCSNNSSYVKIDQVSPYFLDAVVLSEDDKFYVHQGFDWRELKKSFMVNLRSFAFVRGGSTISQQLVKNVYLGPQKTVLRKIKEAYLAHQIEKKYSKKLILEKYINTIELGDQIWGIKEASQHYFGVHPQSLGVLQSLYLVVLLPSPVKYSRSFSKKQLSPYQQKRIETLLERLKKRGRVEADYANYLKGEIPDFPWEVSFEDVNLGGDDLDEDIFDEDQLSEEQEL